MQPLGKILIQFADNLSLAATSYDACVTDSMRLLSTLADKSHCTSLARLQFVQPQVQYLFHILSKEQSFISSQWREALQRLPVPKTKKDVMSFLGMVNYCCHWIPYYALHDHSLHPNTQSSIKPPAVDRWYAPSHQWTTRLHHGGVHSETWHSHETYDILHSET